MVKRNRSAAGAGVLLVLLGTFLLALQLNPQWRQLLAIEWSWPLAVVAVGVGLLALGLVTGTPGMAVPAVIVAGIGAILYWQNATGDWFSWVYAWALIPGFVGAGGILAAILGEGGRREVLRGAEAILTSLVLFTIFGALFGRLTFLGVYWPSLLIAVGLVQLLRRLLRPYAPASAPGP